MNLRIHSRIEHSTVNGPGDRAVLWTQGCGLHCSSCWNPETHSHANGKEYSVSELLGWLSGIVPDIDGITISGGEPIEQAPALFELVLAIRLHFPRLSLGMFSGYSERELEKGCYVGADIAPWESIYKRALWLGIRSHLDFAVLGRFNRLQPSNDPLVTSRNQQLKIYRRYKPEDFSPQGVEVSIDPKGLSVLTGFPTHGNLEND